MGSGVAQLVERSLLNPEVHGSNPVNRHRKDENEEKRGWEWPINFLEQNMRESITVQLVYSLTG